MANQYAFLNRAGAPWYTIGAGANAFYNTASAFVPRALSSAYSNVRDTVGYLNHPFSVGETRRATISGISPMASRLATLYDTGVRNAPAHSYSPIYRYARALFTTASATGALVGAAKYAGSTYNKYNERAARIAGRYANRMFYNRKVKIYYKKGYVGPRTARLSRALARKRRYRKRAKRQ